MTEIAPHTDISSDADIASDVLPIDSKKSNTQKKNIFTYNPEDYQDEYAKNGFILIKNGIDDDFLAAAIEQAQKQKSGDEDIKNQHFKGKKRQYLFDFDAWDFYDAGLKTLARTASLSEQKVTLCERHIKVYEPDATAKVPAHKDRVAAQLTVGIPLFIPESSHIVLWPNDYLSINSLNSTALWRTNHDEKDLPENILKDIEPLRIYAEPGDVVLFRGNTIHHERENPANAHILYLKLNDMRLDPLAEDPTTTQQQIISQQILTQFDDQKLLDCFVEVSPRLEKISRHYTRLNWKEVIQAYVSNEKEFNLTELEFEVFKKIENQINISELMSRLDIPESEHINYIPMIRRLVKLKGLNLIHPIN